ncbi:MAG: hypothetical protein FWF09_01665 [Bacteroidales bacterium]|nr:hypothetical protein [Bacteroidales bacterium]
MKSYFYLLMTVLAVAIGGAGCKCSTNIAKQEPVVKEEVTIISVKQEEPTNISAASFALPNVIIYKTKADYSKNVPIGLDDERASIVSYPGQTDLKGQEPIPLKYGFLLDRRGIRPNVAFLKYTYDEYLALEKLPSMAEMFANIIDADPLTEMYNCGKVSDFHHGDLEELLNQALTENDGNPAAIYKRLK